jgi:cyclomaltodextrinase
MGDDWVRHAIWWQVFPLGFVGAEPALDPIDGPVRHRLHRIVEWLDYAVELGASGLALGPVFASGTHGYDTVDHFRVDPRLGDADDLAELFAAARSRGMRVLLDGVFHHVGRGFPAFARTLAEGPGAPEAGWFRRSRPGDPAAGAEPEYDTFEGHHALVALDHANPAVADYVVEVMNHWLDAGADGWRLDAAYAVPPEFWAAVLPRVRARHPDAYVVAEVIHGDYAEIVERSGVDAVTQYELWKAVWSSLTDHNLHELAWALQRHNDFLGSFVPLTFVGNHDVTRIASAIPDERHLPHGEGAPGGRGRRDPPRLPRRRPGRARPVGVADLPAPPGADRAAPPPPVAAPGPDHARGAAQRPGGAGDRGRAGGRRAAPPARAQPRRRRGRPTRSRGLRAARGQR